MSENTELLTLDDLDTDTRRLRELQSELDGVRHRARIDIENLQADIISKNREVDQLKRKLSEFIDPDSDESKEVAMLLKLWWTEVKDSSPRVHYGLDSTRAPKVRAALRRRKKKPKGGTGDRGGLEICRKAVLGVKFDDWAMGRNPKCAGREFNDIAEHILNTDNDIEKFAALYDRCHVTSPQVYRQLVANAAAFPERHRRRHPMRIALEGLRELGCDWRESTTPGQYVSQCPLHEDYPWSLYVRMASGRCRLLCALGCDEYALLMAVGFTGPSNWAESPHPVRESVRLVDDRPVVAA